MSHRRIDRTAGIVLAGNYPWSKSRFDAVMPRALLPIAHQPLISYSIAWLGQEGIQRVAVCGNRNSGSLETTLARHSTADVVISYLEDVMPRGSAGSARDAAALVRGETFVVAEGTAIPSVRLSALLNHHRTCGAAATVVVYPRGRPGGARTRISSGTYVFERRVLDMVPTTGFWDIKENLIGCLYEAGEQIALFEAADPSPRVVSADSYMAVNGWAVQRLVADGGTPPEYRRSGDALIHVDASVARDAILVGPVLIGPGVSVASGTLIVGPSSIGPDTNIEAGCVVCRSAIWRRAVLGERAIADRSIVTDHAVVGTSRKVYRTLLVAAQDRARAAERTGESAVSQRVTSEFGRRISRLLSQASWSQSLLP